jgi:hypothetical protein
MKAKIYNSQFHSKDSLNTTDNNVSENFFHRVIHTTVYICEYLIFLSKNLSKITQYVDIKKLSTKMFLQKNLMYKPSWAVLHNFTQPTNHSNLELNIEIVI